MESNQKTKSNVERIEKLTALQEGMYFYYEMNPHDGSYHEQNTYRIRGNFRYEYAQTAMNLLAQAHDVLRTSFITLKKGEIVQVVLKERKLECSYEKTEKSLEELQQEDIQRGFDLQKDPLLRLKIAEIGEQDYYLLWSFHHIIMDGWCMSIIMGDFLRFYNALANGAEETTILKEIQNSLATKPNYGTFLELNAERDKEEALHFWSEMLEGYENVAKIPPLSSDQQEPSFQEEEMIIWLSEELTALLQKRAGEAQVTVNTIMEAAWGIVLQQYTHAQDAVFGKVVSGRNADIPGIEQIVGLFINTIPCRVKIEEGESIEVLLRTVQSNANRADEYDFAPLAEIQANSMVGRDLIQTLFVFENYYFNQSAVEEGMQGTEIEILQTREQTGYAITVLVTMSKQISIKIMYDAHKYSAEEIKEILSHYRLVLEEIGKDLKRPAEQIAMCTALERKQTLEAFNDTATDYPKDKTVIDLFEEQVEKTPENVAVVFEDTQLSYRELNEKSNQFARYLQSFGVQKGDTVALLSERTTDFVVGITGVLKAGAVYLPIDSNYPEQRIRLLLEDSGAKALILGGNKAIDQIDIPQLRVSDAEATTLSDDEIHVEKTARDLAYIIYTSGTTGRPKGAMIEDISIIRLVKENNYLKLDEHTRILQTGSMAFDAATLEVWGALLNGGRLYLTGEETLLKPEELEEEINRNGITTMWMTSTLFNQMINLREGVFDRLEDLLIGGEKLSADHVNRFLRRKNGVRLTNGYGPTENTTFTTTYLIENESVEIPIGKPINGTRIYMLSENRLCGIGMPGELCVAGDGLARGYLNQPELTAEKFIDNPFGEGKLYRSGDLARWLPDGNIEYLGRIDEQVKIRGFRIELGEIESGIRKIEGIKDCAVIARADANREKAIYAYLVSDQEISISEIRDQLAKTLPDYMIPAYMAQIEQIPVTRNGKLDKRALPEIEGKSEREYIAPRTPEEEAVCAAFSEVLSIEKIGIEDNFFELGGHSLKAIWLVKQIEARTGRKISLNDVLRSACVKELAELIIDDAEKEKNNNIKSYETLSQLTEGKNDPAIICFPFAGGFDSSYWKLSEEIYKLIPKATVYSLKYANWIEIDFNTAMREITDVAEEADSVLIYCHCGGAGMALKVYQQLTKKSKVKHLIIGASLPKRPKKLYERILLPKRYVSDAELKQSLTDSGFVWDDTPDDLQQDVLNQFRKDAESCTKDIEMLYGTVMKDISCTVVVGDADPDIPRIDLVQPLWNRFFENPVDMVVLPGANHYFHKERAGELAEIIKKCCMQ